MKLKYSHNAQEIDCNFVADMSKLSNFNSLPFSALSIIQLYEILTLRQEVFVVEQNCPYLDCDGLDPQSWHLMGYDEKGKLCCYTRLLPLNLPYKGYSSIGRVLTAQSVRNTGAGKLLMKKSIDQCYELFGPHPIKIGAQVYLLKFYESFGFYKTGEEYMEDGIPHIKMILNAPVRHF